MKLIRSYFPALTDNQVSQLEELFELYKDWNSKINVISRKDIDNLYLHHVLHSLSIAKWIDLKPKTKILDLGCGGGFPGIPLAILFPDVDFHLVDSIKKKLKVVAAVAEDLNLKNVRTTHSRAEELKEKYDFVIIRAVASLPKLMTWTNGLIRSKEQNAIPNGLIALKGGNIDEELQPLKKREYYEVKPLSDYFREDFFKEKYLVYVQR